MYYSLVVSTEAFLRSLGTALLLLSSPLAGHQVPLFLAIGLLIQSSPTNPTVQDGSWLFLLSSEVRRCHREAG